VCIVLVQEREERERREEREEREERKEERDRRVYPNRKIPFLVLKLLNVTLNHSFDLWQHHVFIILVLLDETGCINLPIKLVSGKVNLIIFSMNNNRNVIERERGGEGGREGEKERRG
jgi:hypothetical protein